MSEMIERVAKAIAKVEASPVRPWHFHQAKAAIEEMREPAEAMLAAMEPWARVPGHHKLVWTAGVDEALGKER